MNECSSQDLPFGIGEIKLLDAIDVTVEFSAFIARGKSKEEVFVFENRLMKRQSLLIVIVNVRLGISVLPAQVTGRVGENGCQIPDEPKTVESEARDDVVQNGAKVEHLDMPRGEGRRNFGDRFAGEPVTREYGEIDLDGERLVIEANVASQRAKRQLAEDLPQTYFFFPDGRSSIKRIIRWKYGVDRAEILGGILNRAPRQSNDLFQSVSPIRRREFVDKLGELFYFGVLALGILTEEVDDDDRIDAVEIKGDQSPEEKVVDELLLHDADDELVHFRHLVDALGQEKTLDLFGDADSMPGLRQIRRRFRLREGTDDAEEIVDELFRIRKGVEERLNVVFHFLISLRVGLPDNVRQSGDIAEGLENLHQNRYKLGF